MNLLLNETIGVRILDEPLLCKYIQVIKLLHPSYTKHKKPCIILMAHELRILYYLI